MRFVLAAATAAILTACGQQPTPQAERGVAPSEEAGGPPPETAQAPRTVLDVLEADGHFGTLLQALDAAGLTDTLREEGTFTLLAPTDAAFEELTGGDVQVLLSPQNRAALRELLRHHLLRGDYAAEDLTGETTLAGDRLRVGRVGDRLVVADAVLVGEPLRTGSGTVHALDAVMIPPGPAD